MPSYIFSGRSEVILKVMSSGVISFKFLGEEKKSQANSRDIGNSCTETSFFTNN